MRPGLALLAAFLVLQLLPAPAHGDWAQFHADSVGSGRTESTHAVYEGIWWSTKGATDKAVRASPVVKDGRLISADMGGSVRALDVESGFEFWSHKMAGPIESTPAVAGDQVFVLDTTGKLKALNIQSGRVEKETTAAPGRGPIAYHEGKIYFGTETGEVRAYLGADLTHLWTFRSGQVFLTMDVRDDRVTCKDPLSARPIRSKPAIYDGKVFFGSENHHVIAVSEGGNGDLTTNVQWIYKTGDLVEASPAVVATPSGARLVVGSYDGKVYAFAPTQQGEGTNQCWGRKDVQPTWTFRVPSVQGSNQVSKVHSSPAAAGGRIFFGANNGKTYALFAGNGTHAWNQTTGNEILKVSGSPAVTNDLVIVGGEDKGVYWLAATSGQILKKFTGQQAFLASPAIDGDKAFLADQDGTWYVFGPAVPPRPDLVVSKLTAEPRKVTVTVRNQGDAPSGATVLRVAVDGGLLFEAEVGELDGGAEQSVTRTDFTIPRGDRRVVAGFVDPLNAVKEGDESNNAFGDTFRIGTPPNTNTPTQSAQTTTEKGPAWGLAAALLALGLVAWRRRGSA